MGQVDVEYRRAQYVSSDMDMIYWIPVLVVALTLVPATLGIKHNG